MRKRRRSICQEHAHPTRLSFVSRSSNSPEPVAPSLNSPQSSSPPERPSAPGSNKRISMRVPAPTGSPPPSGRNCTVSGRRSAACSRSATSWQKPRPGSHGRQIRYRRGLRIHKSAPGRIPHRHPVPRAGCLHPTMRGETESRRRQRETTPC